MIVFSVEKHSSILRHSTIEIYKDRDASIERFNTYLHKSPPEGEKWFLALKVRKVNGYW